MHDGSSPALVTPVDPSMSQPVGAAIVIGILATAVLLTIPVIAPAMARQVGGGTEMTGYAAAADMLGSAIASLTAARWVRRVSWTSLLRVALSASAAVNLLSIVATTPVGLLSLRLVAGLCSGLVLSLVFITLCHGRAPDRSFGFYVLGQLLLQIIMLPVFAVISERGSNAGIYLVLAGFALLSALLASRMPEGRATIAARSASGAVPTWRGYQALTVIFLGVYFIGSSQVWAFLEPIGRTFGLGATGVGQVLGLSSAAGIAGAGAVLILRHPRLRWLLILAGGALSFAAIAVLMTGGGYWEFLVATALFNFALNFTFPYLMAVIAKFDVAGETAMLSLASQILGLAAGPILASLFLAPDEGLRSTLVASLAAHLIGVALFVRADRAASAPSMPR